MTPFEVSKNPVIVLTKARKLLSDEKNWSKDARARDKHGNPCHPGSSEAVAWDIESAVGICDNPNGITPIPLLYLIDEATRTLFPVQVKLTHIDEETGEEVEAVWAYFGYETANFINDWVRHEEILHVLDLAIELARRK